MARNRGQELAGQCEFKTNRRVQAKKQARKVKFYAPDPLPDGWPDGSTDNHFLEEKMTDSNSPNAS